MKDDEVETMIEDCERRSDQLSDWEARFIDSVSREPGGLSPRQREKLDEIWERVTS